MFGISLKVGCSAVKILEMVKGVIYQQNLLKYLCLDMFWFLVAYYLTCTGIKSLDFANLIVEIIKQLLKVNIKCKVHVCDQESYNKSAYLLL